MTTDKIFNKSLDTKRKKEIQDAIDEAIKKIKVQDNIIVS